MTKNVHQKFAGSLLPVEKEDDKQHLEMNVEQTVGQGMARMGHFRD